MKLLLGDCLIKLKELEDNSIDAIVTDPPYGLSFMGKKWDYDVPKMEVWQECLRVLKPGGYLLSFAGARTQHRMAVNIEDAGFEIRDMIAWVYGCLSEDTEILTESGYKPLYKLTQYDKIAVYDIKKDIYQWERPQRYSVYKVHQDTAYRIKSDYTDQIVSRNHRCLVEREGKLVFIQAEELNEVEYMPTLSDDFYSLQERHRKLLLKELLWKGKRLAQKLFSKWTGKEMSSERIEVRKEPSLEGWYNLLEETRKLQADKICEVSEGVFTDGEKRWICNGTSFDNGSILGDMFRENPSSASYQSRPAGQPTGKSDVISVKQGTQIIRRATITKIEYSGIIFCPTVSTGAFVARRNGQVFITGNSGFPKSLNIGKAVDKTGGQSLSWFIDYILKVADEKGISRKELTMLFPSKNGNPTGWLWNKQKTQGITLEQYHKIKEFLQLPFADITECEREVVGRGKAGLTAGTIANFAGEKEFDLTKGTSEWEGWGTALKPAVESITVALKPFNTVPYCDIIEQEVKELLCQLQQLAKTVVESSKSSQVDTKGESDIAQWSAGEYTSTQEGLSVLMGMLQLESGRTLSLNIVLSWLSILGEALKLENKSTIEMKISLITELRTLNSLEWGNISQSIIQAKDSQINIQNADVLTVVGLFIGLEKKLRIIQEPFVVENAILREREKTFVPNLSPIIMSRKPISEKTVAENCLKWGVGGINIDGCRVGTEDTRQKTGGAIEGSGWGTKGGAIAGSELGRFPANLIHDGSEEVVEGFPSDSQRFFYCAKASKRERNMGCEGLPLRAGGSNAKGYTKDVARGLDRNRPVANNHPTVKPLSLMEYLVKLVSREGQVVLDPFMGSGTTGMACKKLGRDFVGIEMMEEYMEIAKCRIEAVEKKEQLNML